jgi:hypothetical protein
MHRSTTSPLRANGEVTGGPLSHQRQGCLYKRGGSEVKWAQATSHISHTLLVLVRMKRLTLHKSSLYNASVQRTFLSEHAEHVDELIIYRIIFCCKLSQEHAGEICSFLVSRLVNLMAVSKERIMLSLSISYWHYREVTLFLNC